MSTLTFTSRPTHCEYIHRKDFTHIHEYTNPLNYNPPNYILSPTPIPKSHPDSIPNSNPDHKPNNYCNSNPNLNRVTPI